MNHKQLTPSVAVALAWLLVTAASGTTTINFDDVSVPGPTPGAIRLGMIGTGLVGWMRR